MSNIMTAREIRKTFETGKNQLNVLKSVNLEVKKGELLMIVGPSGAGKSTLLAILGGLSRPGSGRVLLNDEDMYTLNDEKLAMLRSKRLGFVFNSDDINGVKNHR